MKSKNAQGSPSGPTPHSTTYCAFRNGIFELNITRFHGGDLTYRDGLRDARGSTPLVLLQGVYLRVRLCHRPHCTKPSLQFIEKGSQHE
jgi:hypothetical protein